MAGASRNFANASWTWYDPATTEEVTMNVLRVLANPKPVERSASLQIEQAFTAALKAKHPDAQVGTIDVYLDEVPLIDGKVLPAHFGAPPADAETARKMARRGEILAQFLAADLIVIATPMWNFNAPPA